MRASPPSLGPERLLILLAALFDGAANDWEITKMSINGNGSRHQRDAETIWATAEKSEAGWRAAVAEHARLPDAWWDDYIAVQRASNLWFTGSEVAIGMWEMIFAIEIERARAERRAARRAAREARQ
jgi:hypothetical protein